MNTDVLPRLDAHRLQVMSESVRSQFEFGVAQSHVFQNQGNSIGDRIGNGLEQIGNVQGHRNPHYTRLRLPVQVFREANTLVAPCSPELRNGPAERDLTRRSPGVNGADTSLTKLAHPSAPPLKPLVLLADRLH